MVYHFTSREKNILHYLSISDTYILGKNGGKEDTRTEQSGNMATLIFK